MEKKISVIIPCYNVENLINRCLESIANQSIGIENLEIILINDASTDGTWEKLLEFESRFPDSVMAINFEVNSLQGTARNVGIEYSTASLVTFIDSDDWIEEDMLECMYSAICGSSFDFVMMGHVRDDGFLDKNETERLFGGDSKSYVIDTDEKRKLFILCMSIGTTTWAKLYKKDFIKNNNIYYVEGFPYEDHMFTLLLYLYAKNVLMIGKLGYHYYVNQNSTVLSKNSTKHSSQIIVDDMVWDECADRGFLDKFREELEVYFLQVGFLAPFKNMPLLFDEAPYEFFLRLKDETIRKVPNYINNKYINEYFTEFDRMLLGLLSVDINETDFLNVCNAIKVKKGIK